MMATATVVPGSLNSGEKIISVRSSQTGEVYPRKGQVSSQETLDKSCLDFDRKSGKITDRTKKISKDQNHDRVRGKKMNTKTSPKQNKRGTGAAANSRKKIPFEDINPLVESPQKIYALADPKVLAQIERGEQPSFNSIAQQSENWQRYLDVLRQVRNRQPGETVPDALIAVRRLCELTGTSIHTVRGLDQKFANPDTVPKDIMARLAKAGRITEAELRLYIIFSVFDLGAATSPSASKDVTSATGIASREDLLFYLSRRNVKELGEILKLVTDQITDKLTMVTTVTDADNTDDYLSEANDFILDLLDEFKESRGLSDEDFKVLLGVYKISLEEIEAIEKDERPTVKFIGNLARMTGRSIDELMEVVNRSYPSS